MTPSNTTQPHWQIGLIPIDTGNPLEALIFGALISAVDPVATLSIIGWVAGWLGRRSIQDTSL